MLENNPFLTPGAAATFKGGGGGVIEDPRAVDNIVFQTRTAPLGAFESRLAEDLMQVFGAGATDLAAVVEGLIAAGSTDADGLAWTERSLAAQLKQSGDALFSTVDGAPDHG